MESAPTVLPCETFARLPDALRIRGRTSRWSRINHPGSELHSFLEGPAFDRHGNLHAVDVAWGRIFRISPAGTFSVVAEYDGAPCGLAIHRDGRIYIADWFRGILVLDPETGIVHDLATHAQGEPFLGVNDLTFAPDGSLYFTDQGLTGLHDPRGRLYRMRPNGSIDVVVDRLPSPNGLALAPDRHSLLLSVTRDNAVWRVPIDADGRAYKVGAYVRLSGGTGPDGLAMCADGGLVVAHVGRGTVWHFDARGALAARCDTAGRFPSNVAFGPEGGALYITEAETGEVLRCSVPARGLALFSHT